MKFSTILIVIILLAVPLISAQPVSVQTNLNAEVGIGIQFPQLFHLQQNRNFTFSFHIFNKSSGILMTNETVICGFHLYDDDGETLVPESQLEFQIDDDSFEIVVDKGNFTRLGQYSHVIHCNNSVIGGFDAIGIEVTADGLPSQTFPTQFLIIMFSFFLIILGLMNERWRMFKYLGSLFFIIMGLLTLYPGYSFINWTTLEGKALGSILVALGFYFLIEDSFSRDEQAEYYSQGREF